MKVQPISTQLYANVHIVGLYTCEWWSGERNGNKTIMHTKIESMKKILKSHREALDFDRAFVVTSIKMSDVELDWQKELGDGEEMTNKKRKRTK